MTDTSAAFQRQVYAALGHLGDAAQLASDKDRSSVLSAIACLLGCAVSIVGARLAIGDEATAKDAEVLWQLAHSKTADVKTVKDALDKTTKR